MERHLIQQPQMTTYGDLSYLLRSEYEAAMRLLILQAKKVSMRDLRLYDEQDLRGNSKPYANEKKSVQVGALCSSKPLIVEDHLRADLATVQQQRTSNVYLVPYLDEDYPMLARALRIWPFPRAHFSHIARLPYR